MKSRVLNLDCRRSGVAVTDGQSGEVFIILEIYFLQIGLPQKWHNHKWTQDASILAEIGSCQLEFAYLSYHTVNDTYRKVARFAVLRWVLQ